MLLLSFEPLKCEQFCFRVYLNDKGNSGYSIEHPEDFLSQEAIDRRRKEGLPVDESDLPIAHACLDTLTALGAHPVVTSKWFATVVVACDDSLTAKRLQQLPIIDSVKWVWKGERKPSPGGEAPRDTTRLAPGDETLKNPYGYAETQIKMLTGIRLHQKGYRGKGMTVAVIDAGFMNVDRMTVFDSLRLAGTYNVVSPGESVFSDDDHGTKVLSCLAANAPGIMVGTAPEATYWLIKSEDNRSEYPIEEDYWTSAVEFADSAGVDAISSSLGYFTFDDPSLNYHPSMLDGQTSFISRAAGKAARKGILLFVSAGNEGDGCWSKLTFPSDAQQILTVGSITEKKEKSSFSSTGPAADMRIKPDVVALGSGCTVIDGTGNIHYASGTSFSTPIVAGLGICLLKALPQLNSRDIIQLIQRSASQYERPDGQLGYGIPDFYKTFKQNRKQPAIKQ
ncbi:MAG: S8 family serine peptidase [Tannerellaceae bacterium]|nr:S8 family serine peptidase [Tannerellaceae bacterium]